MAGFFFCLASDTVQGFYFALTQYSHTQAFTACFAVSMQLYRPHNKTAHRALQRRFLRLHTLNSQQYQTDKSGYNTTCATLEGIHAPGRAQQIPDTTAAPGRCAGQHSPLIIIRYIRGCRGAPYYRSMPDSAAYRRPCAPAEGSASPPVQGQPGGTVQRQGTRRAARNHWRLPPHLFSGFRPITNRGQQ